MTNTLNKIYEDASIIVLDKPTGVIVNRSHTTKATTLQDLLDNEYEFLGDEEFVSRSGIVHRIDKDTSGILVVAKTPECFYFLQAQFKERKVAKTYIAITHGHIKDDIISIDAPIGRNPKIPFKMAVVYGGKDAETTIEVQNRFESDGEKLTYLQAKPKTGRTHQIRVHLSALGHSIVHDPIYCTRKVFEEDSRAFNRLLLHALKISFMHPKTGDTVEYATSIPADFNM